jgi:hypothetical protein
MLIWHYMTQYYGVISVMELVCVSCDREVALSLLQHWDWHHHLQCVAHHTTWHEIFVLKTRYSLKIKKCTCLVQMLFGLTIVIGMHIMPFVIATSSSIYESYWIKWKIMPSLVICWYGTIIHAPHFKSKTFYTWCGPI